MQLGRIETQKNWLPLLDERQGRDVLTSVKQIAAALESSLKQAAVKEVPAPLFSPDLGNGAAGIALFFAYLQAAGLSAPDMELPSQFLDVAIGAAADQVMGPSLYSGFTGIGWAVQHVDRLLAGPLADGAADDSNSEIDGAVEQYLSNANWNEDYDLINGLVGLGVYCLERTGSESAARSLALIVDRLYDLAERSEDAVCWFTDPRLLGELEKQSYPRGHYNVGLAHGVSGIIAALGRIYVTGIAQEKTKWLLERAVKWLLNQRLPQGSRSQFPAVVEPQGSPADCRLAWCYGDAGTAAALLLAARCTGSKPWEQEALLVAKAAAMRDPDKSGIVDACFCHGTAGLAHIFNRIFQATDDEFFAQASRSWVERTLQFQQLGKGPAGYRVWGLDAEGKRGLVDSLGMIDGIAGIGLALLATITDIEPCWDSMFLVNVPPKYSGCLK